MRGKLKWVAGGTMTEITDTSERSALDRRSAIKKVAVGGAIAWTAPAVLSSRVSAQEVTCTPKCRPVGGVVITADVRIAECGPRPPAPGNQPVNGQLVSVTAAGDSCGCGGTPTVVVVSPAIGDTFEIRPNPGNESAFFTVAVQLTCLDRQDRPVTVNCDIDFESGDPGNCQARGGDLETYFGAAVCGPPDCTADE